MYFKGGKDTELFTFRQFYLIIMVYVNEDDTHNFYYHLADPGPL